jgi:ectoine hydroxylase-related dioxygenase (phytanoyl-CoA dioxygenase family)
MTTTTSPFVPTIASADVETLAADYERDGVIRLRQLLRPEELSRIRQELDRYAREVVPGLPAGDYVLERDGKTPRVLFRMEKHDAFFREFPARPDLLALVARLVHGEPVVTGVESFCKPARIGAAVPPHQDNAYFCQTPPDMLTVWIAIDPATEANGAVTHVRGSHRHGMLPHRSSGVAGNSMMLTETHPYRPSELFVGLLEPGDALIHHCQTIHFSAPNTSAQSRRGLLVVARGAHTQRDPALQAAYDKVRAGT